MSKKEGWHEKHNKKIQCIQDYFDHHFLGHRYYHAGSPGMDDLHCLQGGGRCIQLPYRVDSPALEPGTEHEGSMGRSLQFWPVLLKLYQGTVLATFFQVFVSALGAYGFSKIKFKGRDALFLAYLATMMIPPQVTIVSQFIITRQLGLYNTHAGLIAMLAFSVYGVFLLRQAMMAVPDSLSESAQIDGAGHLRIFFQIILPMVKPSLATLATLKFVWTWNDYQHPLVFLSNRDLYTIQLGMKQFASESGSYYALTMAAAVSAIVPLVIVFLLCQRFVVDGIATGAVKG